MENYEDDDDTHFCNKCHSTINGLENYVRHRQSGCRSTVTDKTEVYHCSASTPTVSYPDEILNADAFFSSLELQSSAKSRRTTDLLDVRPRRSNRNEERRKKRRKDKNQVDKDENKEKLANLLPVVTDLDDFGIPSLVGFPELVAAAKPSTSNVNKQIISHSVKNDYPSKHAVGGAKNHHEDHWLEDAILTDLDVNNENETKEDIGHLGRYADYDYHHHQDEESDDDSIDVDMPDEDSYSESDDPEPDPDPEVQEQDHDPEYPPQTHTGGKWKPGGIAQEEIQEEDVDIEENEHQHEHPPPSHTGGKWKPADSTIQKCDEYVSKDVSGQPPPGHTRGKWVPGARADIGTGYWCSPCGRKLASRLVYNRHLLSDLHARRTIQEIDGAVQMHRGAAPLLHRRNLSRRQKILALNKSKESPEESTLAVTYVTKSSHQKKNQKKKKKKKRQRVKEVLSCEMCHARVRRAQMGKHLLSHYHCRVAGANPSGTNSRRFLLENMGNIVRQCPFQCAPCRFYCNTVDTFLRHWRSETHKHTVAKIGGSFVCALCDFWCDDNESVEAHIMKQGHQDVVAMINGSVPIVIRRQRVLTCLTCCRRFRYNIQLRYHSKETGHKVDYSASDEYQRRISCKVCGQIVRSLISLQRHQLTCHKPGTNETSGDTGNIPTPYFCSFCTMTFKTARDAVLHRRTSDHKEMVKSKKSDGTSATSTGRICSHCGQKQNSLAEHKVHLLTHPELCHRCPKCGEQFAFSQDVTRHTRENKCEKQSVPLNTEMKQWSCTDCPFTSDSEAEYLFHVTLHGECIRLDSTNDKGTPMYTCPVCDRTYRKSTLRDHLRKHTGERPFPCTKCPATFSRRSAMKIHQKDCVGSTGQSSWTVEKIRERKYGCSECNSAFLTKHNLRQHMLRHAGKQYKCGLPGCPTILRTETELKNHRKLVHEVTNRDFHCDDCSYAAKTKLQLIRHRKKHEKNDTDNSGQRYTCPHADCNFQTKISSHLKRHVRLHTGKKPYKCRHCNYASNNLENLRKHVLSTNLHPGKMIYQCDSCVNTDEPYQTNFTKELRAHLLESHPNEYPTPNHASNYISSIFNDTTLCDKQ